MGEHFANGVLKNVGDNESVGAFVGNGDGSFGVALEVAEADEQAVERWLFLLVTVKTSLVATMTFTLLKRFGLAM